MTDPASHPDPTPTPNPQGQPPPSGWRPRQQPEVPAQTHPEVSKTTKPTSRKWLVALIPGVVLIAVLALLWGPGTTDVRVILTISDPLEVYDDGCLIEPGWEGILREGRTARLLNEESETLSNGRLEFTGDIGASILEEISGPNYERLCDFRIEFKGVQKKEEGYRLKVGDMLGPIISYEELEANNFVMMLKYG